MNNNSNNICARAASSGLTTLQQYRWIYWWLNNINLSYSKSYLEQHWNMLQPSGDFIRPCHTAYLTMKFTNLLSQLKHFCVKVTKRVISSSYKGKRQHLHFLHYMVSYVLLTTAVQDHHKVVDGRTLVSVLTITFRFILCCNYTGVVAKLWSRDCAGERPSATSSRHWSAVWRSARGPLRRCHCRRQ